MVVHVWRVNKCDLKLKYPGNADQDSHPPVTLYELWGTTDESRGRFVNLIVYDPPVGMPLGSLVHEDVRFAGYFFRVQGYIPAKAPLNSRPELAPSFIGRVDWKAQAAGLIIEKSELPWLMLVGGGALAILLAWVAFIVFSKRPRNVAEHATDLPPPPSMSVEDWLDRVEANDGDAGDGSENFTSDSMGFGAPLETIVPARAIRGDSSDRLIKSRG